VLHFHDFDHVQIDWFGGLLDGEDRVDDGYGEGLGEVFGEFCREGCSCYLEENVSVNRSFYFEFIKELLSVHTIW